MPRFVALFYLWVKYSILKNLFSEYYKNWKVITSIFQREAAVINFIIDVA